MIACAAARGSMDYCWTEDPKSAADTTEISRVDSVIGSLVEPWIESLVAPTSDRSLHRNDAGRRVDGRSNGSPDSYGEAS
jgi:hypothetical protein